MKPFAYCLCALLLHGGLTLAAESASGLTGIPFTYVMAYGKDVPKDPNLLSALREAPPDLLHIGHGVPLNSIFGPAADYSGFNPELVPVQTILDRREELKSFVQAVHQTGVNRVICYINPSILGGDHGTREGFWAFYDCWDDYARLGIGAKPERTPEQWMQRDRRSFAPWEPEPNYRLWRYQPCVNEPAWSRYQEAVVRLIVESGYDGVFVDDCIMECRHDLCQQQFAQHLRARYDPGQRRRLWQEDYRLSQGRESASSAGMENLRRAETFLFWQQSVAHFLQTVRRVGQATNPDFIIVPNWGAISRVSGAAARTRSGKNVAIWSTACDYQMFEEDHPAGSFGDGETFGHLAQYLHALALGVRPVILTYASSEPQFELGYAECAAGGGGAFVQPGLAFPEIRRKWRAFYATHRDLFQGHEVVAPVGLVISFDEPRFGNDGHLLAAYALTRVLMARHIPFAIVPGERLAEHRLLEHQVVILPEVHTLSEAAVGALRSYRSSGGSLLSIGPCGALDDVGMPRPPGALTDLGVTDTRSEPHPSSGASGSIAHVMHLEELVGARDLTLTRILDVRDPAAFQERLRRLPESKEAFGKREVLVQWLDRLANRPLSVIANGSGTATRMVIYQRLDADQGSLCAHAVRYPVALGTGARLPSGSKPLELQLPLPTGWTARHATLHTPGQASLEVPIRISGGRVHCSLPAFEFYALLSAKLERLPPAPPPALMPIPGGGGED